jgi:4-amino-4-deoxy-L-arabinose transferase-like glycosyltransferase
LRPTPLVAVVAFAKLGILLTCVSAYGYSREELYSLARAHRLAWGYVDHPPLSMAVLSFASRVYGETLATMRLVPAVTGVLVIVLTARLARRFGAPPRAQALAALATLTAPDLLGLDHVYSSSSLEVLFWIVTAGLVARAITVAADDRHTILPWIRVGLIVGLGALDSLAVLGFAAALLAALGLPAVPQHALSKRRGPWLAVGVATVVFSPYLSWQRAHGWIGLEFVGGEPSLEAVARQLVGMGPVNALVWGAGLLALLRSKALEQYRLLGAALLLWLAVWALSGGRTGALAPACPILFAAGAASLDPWLSERRWRTPALSAALLVSAAVVAPFEIPILRVGQLESYARALHVAGERDPTTGAAPLPMRYADMYGWPELARAVAAVTSALPPLDRDDAVVLAQNYGEAGALEAFGAAVGLPPVISGHDQYYLWGTAGRSGDVVVAVGVDEALLKKSFTSVELLTLFGHSRAAPAERHVKIYLCKGSLEPLDVMWPRFRHR